MSNIRIVENAGIYELQVELKRLPYLHNFIQNFSSEGLCFHRSVALSLGLTDTKVVMGILKGASPEEAKALKNPLTAANDFVHCWVEWGELVFTPTTYERYGDKLCPITIKQYYKLNGIRETHSFTRSQIVDMALREGWGDYLLKNERPKGMKALGQTLLESAPEIFMQTYGQEKSIEETC